MVKKTKIKSPIIEYIPEVNISGLRLTISPFTYKHKMLGEFHFDEITVDVVPEDEVVIYEIYVFPFSEIEDVIVHIRGEFDTPEDFTNEMSDGKGDLIVWFEVPPGLNDLNNIDIYVKEVSLEG